MRSFLSLPRWEHCGGNFSSAPSATAICSETQARGADVSSGKGSKFTTSLEPRLCCVQCQSWLPCPDILLPRHKGWMKTPRERRRKRKVYWFPQPQWQPAHPLFFLKRTQLISACLWGFLSPCRCQQQQRQLCRTGSVCWDFIQSLMSSPRLSSSPLSGNMSLT